MKLAVRLWCPLEYIASEIQVSAMSIDTRKKLPDAFARNSPVEIEMFNVFSFYSSPQWFVANAYRHFNTIENGCEFLRGILIGEILFPGSFDFE